MKRLQLSVMMIQSYTLTVSGQTYSFQRNEKYLSKKYLVTLLMRNLMQIWSSNYIITIMNIYYLKHE